MYVHICRGEGGNEQQIFKGKFVLAGFPINVINVAEFQLKSQYKVYPYQQGFFNVEISSEVEIPCLFVLLIFLEEGMKIFRSNYLIADLQLPY